MGRSGLVSSFVTVCLLTGLWTTSGQRQCPRLQKPWNGNFVGSCERHVGADCVVECRNPYILVGSRVRQCRADGTWSGRTAACELDGCGNCGDGSSCPGLYDPDNGYTEGQCNPGVVGQTCLFRCSRGYMLEGQSRLTCLTSGQWNSGSPYCRRSTAAVCDNIIVNNGYAQCAQEGGLTVCSVTCADGYMIVGSSIVTCSPSGDWSDQLPYCRRTGTEVTDICPTLVASDGGRLVGSCTAANIGDTCQLVCISGYRPTETRVLICQTNGRWSNSLPRCIGDGGCPSINVPQGITSGTCNPGSLGQTCTITCQPGYTLSGGSGTLVCLSNGQWSGGIPTCTVGSCPALPPPVSGGTSGTCSPGAVGQTCTFYCNSGYRLVGQSILICGQNGQWSSSSPYCAGALTCPTLNPPSNGVYSGACSQAAPGQTCSFTCFPGYSLNGQSTLYCQPGGSWSSLPPTCIPTTSSSCPSLIEPNNGYMLGTCAPGRVGQTCVFGCNEGYVLRGQRTLTCEPGGYWSGNRAYCERSGPGEGGPCPVLTPPPNGEFVECDNRIGGRCVVVCEKGYLRSGSRVRTCLSQGTWSGYAPTCTRKVGYTTYTYKVVPLWSLVFG